MTRTQVVILSDQSLFVEGVASRLQQYPAQLEVHIIDPRESGAMEAISEQLPSAVIMDATDPETDVFCPLCRLLLRLPELKIIRLDPQLDQVQIVTSKCLEAVEVHDLVGMIEIGG
jgi:DNA-binding NarL/FixJ family response regulator